MTKEKYIVIKGTLKIESTGYQYEEEEVLIKELYDRVRETVIDGFTFYAQGVKGVIGTIEVEEIGKEEFLTREFNEGDGYMRMKLYHEMQHKGELSIAEINKYVCQVY